MSTSLLDRYHHSASDVKVAVIGDIMYDEYAICDITGVSPEDEVALKLKPFETFSKPGGAANVAMNLIKMGAKTFLFSVAGDDDEGNSLFDQLSAANVNTWLTFGYREYTTKKTRYITRKGRHLFRVDREQVIPIHETCVENLYHDLKSKGPYDLIVISDYAKGVITPSLMHMVNNLNTPFIVDPKGSYYHKYGKPLLIKPNEQEAIELSIDEAHNLNVLITKAEHGSTLRISTRTINIPVAKRDFGDPAGCGDATIAGAAIALAKGLNIVDACYVANAAGACAFDHTGVYAVTDNDLRRELLNPIYRGDM